MLWPVFISSLNENMITKPIMTVVARWKSKLVTWGKTGNISSKRLSNAQISMANGLHAYEQKQKWAPLFLVFQPVCQICKEPFSTPPCQGRKYLI